MPFLTTDQADVYYEVAGESGPWITLVNGHTRTSKDFKLLTKHLVTAGFRTLTFDNRGSGRTSANGPFTFNDMLDDVTKLWQHLGIRTTHLLGISMGGMLAQKLGRNFPQVVNKLILVSTTASPAWINPANDEGWGHSFEDVKAKLRHYFTDRFAANNKLLLEAMAKQILKAISDSDFQARANEQRQAMQGFTSLADLPHIHTSTLVIHGDKDEVIQPSAAEELASQLPHAKLALLPGAGHLLLAECPKQLYDLVSDFLSDGGN